MYHPLMAELASQLFQWGEGLPHGKIQFSPLVPVQLFHAVCLHIAVKKKFSTGICILILIIPISMVNLYTFLHICYRQYNVMKRPFRFF